MDNLLLKFLEWKRKWCEHIQGILVHSIANQMPLSILQLATWLSSQCKKVIINAKSYI